MKISFLLLLFVIISISIYLSTLRNHVTIEKFQTTFSNAGCTYPDKITRISGSTLNDCDQAQVCKPSFEANDPCIKNNFIDKRCKLIKIWYAKKVKDSYYTFSDDDKHTHIIQMKRDANLNCLQFSDDSELIQYLNNLHISDIKDNTMIFTSEAQLIEYNTQEQIEQNQTTNEKTKLIIGYAHGGKDEDLPKKSIDDMKLCIDFDEKFYDDKEEFKKYFLKKDYDQKTFFHPQITDAKTIETNKGTYKRYIKELPPPEITNVSDSETPPTKKYTIVYRKGDMEKSIEDIIDFDSIPKPRCNSIIEKPDLWIMHGDNKYHRVNFIQPLTQNTPSCNKIAHPNPAQEDIRTNRNRFIKTTVELERLKYGPSDDDPDIYELPYDIHDPTKWFDYHDDGYIISEHVLTECASNQFEMIPPNHNTDGANTSDRICGTCGPSQFIANIGKNKECRDISSIMNDRIKKETHYVTNYDQYDSNLNHFVSAPKFERMKNCDRRVDSEFVKNQQILDETKIDHVGNILNGFYTSDRNCAELNECDNTTKYVANSSYFRTLSSSLNNNHVHSNIECKQFEKCGNTEYIENRQLDKITIRKNGRNVQLNAENYPCRPFTECNENQYVSNMDSLNNPNTKNNGMYTHNVNCTDLTECADGEYQKTAPINDNTLQMFVSDRVCAPVDPCNKPLQVEIPLSSELITQLSSMRFPSPATTQICSFNNDYFTGNDDNLNYFNCSRIKLAYKIIGSPTPTNDILKHSPKLILRKRRKEIIMMMKLNSSSTELTTYDTDTGVGIFSAFKKYPNDVFDLFFDTGSHLHISINISEFKFYCSRIQEIDVSSYKSDDGVVHNNVCRYEHKDIVTCNAHTQYYELDSSSGNYVCKDYEPNDCKISDQKKSCAINNEDYTNENINTSYKRLYNDTLSSDTATQCATKCSERSGCGAFLINPLSNMCEYYGFETVKIEIGNIDISKFNIKYDTDDTSESEVFISKDDNDTISDNGVLTKSFTIPVHITQLTIEPKDSTTRINDLPDDVYIKFYYYDNSYKTYTKSPDSQLSNEVDIDSYIRTDKLLEIQDIYYIPDDQ